MQIALDLKVPFEKAARKQKDLNCLTVITEPKEVVSKIQGGSYSS